MHLTRGYDLVSQVQPGDRVLHWQIRAPRGLVGWSEVELISLIGELSTQSEEFRCRWAAHDVRFHRTGRKRLVHPVDGTLDLDFEVMEFPAHPGLTMLAYTAPARDTDGRQPHDARQLGHHGRESRRTARPRLAAAPDARSGAQVFDMASIGLLVNSGSEFNPHGVDLQ